MTKDAYYFSHDSNARHDPKILSMRSVYGSQGYGWYWILIEMMSEQQGYKLKHTQWVTNAIAMELLCEANSAEKFVNSCITEFELFTSDGEYFWSESLIRRMNLKEEKRKKKVEAGKKGAQKRWENGESEAKPKQSDSTAITQHGKGKESKGKESKVNENKDIKDYMSEIKRLISRYPEGVIELNKTYWSVIQETRASKKIQPSVIYKTMEKWSEFPVPVVEYALKRHLEIAANDKDEKYTIGIMRKTTKEEAVDKLDRMKPKRGVNNHETTQYDNLF